MNFEIVSKNLRKRGYNVQIFSRGIDAAEYLRQTIQGKRVGFGGSETVNALEIYDLLSTNNEVIWHWKQDAATARLNAMNTDVYISSVNALAETGEIVNIDGVGNRCASMFFGHAQIYYLVGRNKLTADYDSAVWRARNVAAPQRAKQLNSKTPCAAKANRCYNCNSPERICRGMVTLWAPLFGTNVEVLLIDDDFGL